MIAAQPPVVPATVQRAIVHRAPLVAFVPARIALGYRYRSWTYAGGAVRISFANRARKEIVFVAAKQRGACERSKEKTFQLAGNRVYWSHTANEQQAWRCVAGVRLVAATAQPPTAFADVGLGRIAASAHQIS